MSGEFPAVAATNQNNNPGSAFAAAVERAKQIAAKITPNSAPSDSQKRPLEDFSGEPEAKKPVLPPGIGGGFVNSSLSPNSPAAQAAAAQAKALVAARVAAASTGGNRGVGASNLPLGPVSSKDIKVPDKMVGLIIGRGGEQITRLQAESGCKIQMAPDSGGTSDRMCTLTGNTQSISKAEDMISQIVQSRSREMMPMGNGLSGGSPNMNMHNNGSRMSDSLGGSGLPPSIPTVSTPSFTQVEIMVPGPKVGLIIGKGGETIKQLQEKSGAKMVVIQDGPSQEAEKPLRISGDPQKVEHAKALVYEFMAEKEQQLQKGRGRSGGGNFGQNNNSRSWDPELTETTIAVPANKCGVIIGKGGETIRQINQQTGAHCEIDRRAQTNMQEKVFIVKGTLEQIDHVKRLFSDKLQMNIGGGNSNGPNSNYGGGSNMSGGSNMGGGVPNFNGGSPWPGGSGSQSFQQAWPNSSQGQNQHQPMQQHPSSGGSGNNNVQINPNTGQPDYSAQWVQYYRSMGMDQEADVIEEQAKASKSGQQPIHRQLPSQVQIPMQGLNNMQQGQQLPIGGQQQPPVSTPLPQQGQGDQNSGAADYSAQWAQYYRQLGDLKKAEMIEAQMKAKMANPQPQSNSSGGIVSSQPNSGNMYNPGLAQCLGGFPTAASNQGYYGGQPSGGGPQYGYPNYGAYPQSSASDSH